ncbi:hypothetical protein ALI144C_31890 [Actinosynnema sp. ALI-1.44]|nr:hypothetical protein ALI144C_31890 [Actinosynnema sp. ALI-1.44]
MDSQWPEIEHLGVRATVCYIRRNGKILLQLKADHKFGGGRWNGPGGKLEPGEDPHTAIVREVREETGLVIADPVFHGVIALSFGVPETYRLTAHVFTTDTFSGSPQGGAEGRLRWFAEDKMPYHQMWVDNRYWLPIVLDGGHVRALCVFDGIDGHTMLDCRLATRLTP